MRIIDRYGGKIITTRDDLRQWEQTETNGSGKKLDIERVNEVLGGRR